MILFKVLAKTPVHPRPPSTIGTKHPFIELLNSVVMPFW